MTKIIVLTPGLPLPFGRADSRWLHAILPELAARGFEVVCLSCTEEGSDQVEEAGNGAAANGYSFRHIPLELHESRLDRKIRSLLRPHSELARCHALKDALEEELSAPCSLLHVESLFSSWVDRPMSRSVTYVHCLEVVDWSGRSALSGRERIDLIQMRRATKRLLKSKQPLIAMTDRLATEVERLGIVRPPVVPIAIDLTLYPVLPFVDAPVVGVIGSMNWHPSRSAAERVLRLWPEIRARVPNATLVVAGWNSDRYLEPWFPLEGAELLGPVERPIDFFGRIALLLYPPARGTGTKVKVLEALAYGVPVISNAEGLEGLDFENMPDVTRAETDDNIVRAVSRQLGDPARRRSVRGAGRRLIEREHSAACVTDQLLAAYDDLGLLA